MSTQEFTDALKRPGWLTFAAVVLFSVGCLRAISTIYYFADSARVTSVSNGALGDHLFLVDQKGARYVDCSEVPLPYAERLVDDILHRTTTSDSQPRTFLAMELALEAEKRARRVMPPTP